ncbi:MAG TPA: alpha/beta hydrolase [Thermoplasmata archaeon]|nr:alpha/beta hydrolase [Thermoplasmata archaeon]
MSGSASPAPPPKGTVSVPGGHLEYEIAGEGPPVLFLHSVIADPRMWNREFSRFARDHRTVRFALRGFAGSTPARGPFSYLRDVEAVVDHLGLRRPYLVGSSMGGAFAIDYALAHPDGVAGLLLAAPGLSGGIDPPFAPAERAAFERDEHLSQAMARAWSEGQSDRAFEMLRTLWAEALTGPSLTLFRAMVADNAEEVYGSRSQAQAEPSPPAFPRLGEIRAPTLVLSGGRDNPVQDVFVRRIVAGIPKARHQRIESADHLINLSRPEDFETALTAELRRAR